MFLIFIFINLIINLVQTSPFDKNEFVVFGLTTNFQIVPGSSTICTFDDHSCYDSLCNTFNNKSCISYVVFSPITTYLNCSQMKSYSNTNMIVFGIHFTNNVDYKFNIINNITTCNTDGDCLMKGCALYNSNYEVSWVLFTGQCHNKTSNKTKFIN
mgnify:CR=1 FL=1